jgi:hypothetical protein
MRSTPDPLGHLGVGTDVSIVSDTSQCGSRCFPVLRKRIQEDGFALACGMNTVASVPTFGQTLSAFEHFVARF